MNREDIIRMAQEAGGIVLQPYDYGDKPDRMILRFDGLQKFAALIAEDCAKRCDEEARIRTDAGNTFPGDSDSRARCFAAAMAAINCAEAIREAYKP